jgi:hypothetical protein
MSNDSLDARVEDQGAKRIHQRVRRSAQPLGGFMTLEDERRSRRFRTRGIDPLTFRVFLSLVGTALFAVVASGISREPGNLEWWMWLLVGIFAFLGCLLWYWALFGSDTAVEKWSDAAGSHEAAAILILIAFPLAWAIRKAFRTDAN